MLILSDTEVRKLITMERAIEASAQAFLSVSAGTAEIPVRTPILLDKTSGSVSLFMPGHMPAIDTLGLKIGSLVTGNPQRNLPATICTILLLDPETTQLACVLEATWLTSLRTGAGVGVATDLLARRDAACFGLLGAGGMAYHQVEAVLAVRPTIERVLVWNRTKARAEELAHQLRQGLRRDLDIIVLDDPESVVRAADIVTASTAAEEAVVLGDWVRPGAHVNLIGAHGPHMREGDNRLLMLSALRTVDMLSAARVSGELQRPIAAGVASIESFVEIGTVAAGRVGGRTSDNEITWFKSVGIAAQDLVTGKFVYDEALRRGVGTKVALYTGV